MYIYFVEIKNFSLIYRCKDVDVFTLYPSVHQYCNNKQSTDQIRPIKFPDVRPSDLPRDSNFSMAAGDFLEVYTEPGYYIKSCVVVLLILWSYICKFLYGLSSVCDCHFTSYLHFKKYHILCSLHYTHLWSLSSNHRYFYFLRLSP